MSAATTYELDPVTVALQAWLAANVLTGAVGELPFPIGDSAAPLDADDTPVPPPYGVIYQGTAIRASVRPYAGNVEVTARWIVTAVGSTPSQTRHYADRVRKAFAGEDADGAQTAMDLTAAGVRVLARRSQEDGALDLVGRIWQWTETFEADLAPA